MSIRSKKVGASAKMAPTSFTKTENFLKNGFSRIKISKISSGNISDQLSILLSCTDKYKEWVSCIYFNPDILTHELSAYHLKSNNAHNVTQYLNPKLFKVGYWLAVYSSGLAHKSWRWRLVSVNQALHLPLHKKTVEKLTDLISEREAANDE